MTGERVFCSRLKREVPTNLNPPRHLRERYFPGFVPRQRKELIACRFSLINEVINQHDADCLAAFLDRDDLRASLSNARD
jgi:hypothetical protein